MRVITSTLKDMPGIAMCLDPESRPLTNPMRAVSTGRDVHARPKGAAELVRRERGRKYATRLEDLHLSVLLSCQRSRLSS